jgi:hypothetical protein
MNRVSTLARAGAHTEVLMSSRRKRSSARGRRSTIPSPPQSESVLTEIEQEWDRLLADYLPAESRRFFT